MTSDEKEDLNRLTDRLKDRAFALGFDLVGVTPVASAPHGQNYEDWVARGFAGGMAYLARNVDKRRHPGRILSGAKSLIAVAMNYRQPETPPFTDERPSGVVAQYARGTDYHDIMLDKLKSLLTFVQEQAVGPVRGKAYVDTGPILEREFATLAGLGWYGKHTNLIHKRMGSWLLLGEILVDVELAYDQPATAHCGTCTRCIEACPTEAIVEPYVVDARACISYLTIELKGSIPDRWRPEIGNRIFGCDDCQDVCPWNRRAPETREPAFLPRPNTLSLVDLMRMTPEDFRTQFKNSPIKRSKRRGFLRNVAVALGNSGDPRAVPALVDALGDEEPLVREHAAWALGRLGGIEAEHALVHATKSELDPCVREAIDRALDTKTENEECRN